IVCNRSIDEGLARAISEIFSEVIIAPDFAAEARAILQKKKNLRLIKLLTPAAETLLTRNVRSVVGGMLVQDADHVSEIKQTVVTKRKPIAAETRALLFGW